MLLLDLTTLFRRCTGLGQSQPARPGLLSEVVAVVSPKRRAKARSLAALAKPGGGWPDFGAILVGIKGAEPYAKADRQGNLPGCWSGRVRGFRHNLVAARWSAGESRTTLPLMGVCLGLVLTHSLSAVAGAYPSRAVRLVVTVEAGGAADATARYLAKELAAQFKQPYVIENRPGVSGLVAVERVASAKPDGYTLLYAADTVAIAPFLVAGRQPVDVESDITPITLVGVAPFIFVVNPRIPVKAPTELVAYIKEHPGGFRWGVGGIGAPGQLAIERFSKLAGISALEVPYKGNGPAAIATLSGEVDGMVALSTSVKPLIDAGKLVGLGVASAEPVDNMPGLPTIASFGFPGYDAFTWFGLWGPKNMPAELAKQIRDQVAEAITAPDLQSEFAATGFMLKISNDPSDFAAYFKSELEKDGTVLKELNVPRQSP